METDKKLIHLLNRLGISKAGALTYSALLQHETISIRKIALQTGINRGTTYELLKQLVIVGLVTVRRKGQREYYTAESPEKIYDLIHEKRHDLLETSKEAKTVVPLLLAARPQSEGRPVVRYYENDDGVVAILKDVLLTCSRLPKRQYCVYSSSRIRQYLYRKFPTFTERRIAEGIDVQVIAVGKGGEPTLESKRKWLPEIDGVDTSSYTLIYGNKVAIISISDNLTPYGVVIKDTGAASMQRLLFEQLWRYL
jgi:HTH-type transcriptional regulator, sugar sensing transcriptional regulator